MDYSALAQKFGGTTLPTSTGNVDYSALAQKFGGSTISPGQSTLPDKNTPFVSEKAQPTVGDTILGKPLEQGLSDAATGVKNTVQDSVNQINQHIADYSSGKTNLLTEGAKVFGTLAMTAPNIAGSLFQSLVDAGNAPGVHTMASSDPITDFAIKAWNTPLQGSDGQIKSLSQRYEDVRKAYPNALGTAEGLTKGAFGTLLTADLAHQAIASSQDLIKKGKDTMGVAKDFVDNAKQGADLQATDNAIQRADELMRQATDTSAQSSQRKVQAKTGDELATVLREEQIPLGTQQGTESVKIDTRKAMPVIQARMSKVDGAIDNALATNPTPQFKLSDIQRIAEGKISDFTSDSTDAIHQKANLQERIKNAINDPRVGDKIYNSKGKVIDAVLNGQELRKLRSGWGSAKSAHWASPTDYNALKQMYFSANDAIEKAYPGQMIPELNKQYTRLISLNEALDPSKPGSLHGKVIVGGGLGKVIGRTMARTIGAGIGAVAGAPLGAVGEAVGVGIGQHFAAKISDTLTNLGLSPEMLSGKAIDLLKEKGVISKTEALVLKANEVNAGRAELMKSMQAEKDLINQKLNAGEQKNSPKKVKVITKKK